MGSGLTQDLMQPNIRVKVVDTVTSSRIKAKWNFSALRRKRVLTSAFTAVRLYRSKAVANASGRDFLRANRFLFKVVVLAVPISTEAVRSWCFANKSAEVAKGSPNRRDVACKAVTCAKTSELAGK